MKDVDLSKFQTYAWLPSPDTGSSAIYDNEILQSNLMGEVNDQMEMRGYTYNGDKPDLLILMHLMFEQETGVYRDPMYSSYDYLYPSPFIIAGYPYYYRSYNGFGYIQGYDIDTVNYVEGTVIIDVIDAKNKRLLWRGWSERMINADNYQSNLTRDVKSIFKEYPVSTRKGYSSSKQLKMMEFYKMAGLL